MNAILLLLVHLCFFWLAWGADLQSHRLQVLLEKPLFLCLLDLVHGQRRAGARELLVRRGPAAPRGTRARSRSAEDRRTHEWPPGGTSPAA